MKKKKKFIIILVILVFLADLSYSGVNLAAKDFGYNLSSLNSFFSRLKSLPRRLKLFSYQLTGKDKLLQKITEKDTKIEKFSLENKRLRNLEHSVLNQANRLSKEVEKLKNLKETLQGKLDKASLDYEKISQEKKNLLRQIDEITREKEKLLTEKEAELTNLKSSVAKLEKVKEENQKFQEREKELLKQNQEWEQKLARTRGDYEKKLSEERASFQESLAKQKKEIEEISQGTKLEGLSTDLVSLRKENKSLADKLRKMQLSFNHWLSKDLRTEKTIKEKEKAYQELLKGYDKLSQENRELQEKMSNLPAKFEGLARENKKLIKETADIHYNTGCFYLKKLEYSLALSEFKRVTELNPNDADAFYYLGYLYAEHLEKRKQSIECLKMYLQLAPDGAHKDWAKKYILTWEAWGGK